MTWEAIMFMFLGGFIGIIGMIIGRYLSFRREMSAWWHDDEPGKDGPEDE